MKALTDRFVPQPSSSKSEKHETSLVSSDSEPSDNNNNKSKFTLRSESSTSGHKQVCAATWTSLVKKVSMASGAIKRFHDRVLGPNRTGLPSTASDVWLLGVCYKISEDESSREETDDGSVVAELKQDFSSRILMTYRKGTNSSQQSFFFIICRIFTFFYILQVLSLLRTQPTRAM